MLRKKALSIVNEWLLSLRLIEAEVPVIPWRLARAMSGLNAKAPLSQPTFERVPGGPWVRRRLGGDPCWAHSVGRRRPRRQGWSGQDGRHLSVGGGWVERGGQGC